MSNTSIYVIYALVDPRDEQVHYVGLSNNARRRFKEHLKAQKTRWMQSLLAEGLEPRLDYLETDIASLQQARDRETYWIAYYANKHHPLENAIGPMEELDRYAVEQDYVKYIRERYQDYPLEEANILVRLTLTGINLSGHTAWNDMYDNVRGIYYHFVSMPGFGLTLTELDLLKLTFSRLGYIVDENNVVQTPSYTENR